MDRTSQESGGEVGDTILRIALAAAAADPSSPLSTAQRHVIVDRLQREAPLTHHSQLVSVALAWADGRSPRLGQTLREALGVVPGAEAEADMFSGLAVLRAYPGQAAREQAEALAQQQQPEEDAPHGSY